MPGSGSLIQKQETHSLWEGLKQFGELDAWLDAARNPERIEPVLREIVPEFKSGKLILEKCEIGHMRFKHDIWEGTYELFVRQPQGENERGITLLGTIFPPGYPISGPIRPEADLENEAWDLFMPELNLRLSTERQEDVLTSLDFLTDPEQACRFLERAIRENNPVYHDLEIQSCTPKVVRYKPGSRCTILYPIEYPAEKAQSKNWPNLVVAKTYRNEKGQNAYDGMRALWQSSLGSSSFVTIAEPLAYLPEGKVLLQGPIHEQQTLKDLMNRAVSDNTPASMELLTLYMKKTAAGLAALHGSGVSTGFSWLWEDELDEARERVNRLSSPLPHLAYAAEPMMIHLKAFAGQTTPDPLVPTHGSFRPAQVLIYQDQIGFIDFDSFCQAEPGHDLALFLATVMSIGLDPSINARGNSDSKPLVEPALSQRREQMLALKEVFLSEYERFRPVSRERVALWEALHIFMIALSSWIKVKTFRLQDCTYLLERHLIDMGF